MVIAVWLMIHSLVIYVFITESYIFRYEKGSDKSFLLQVNILFQCDSLHCFNVTKGLSTVHLAVSLCFQQELDTLRLVVERLLRRCCLLHLSLGLQTFGLEGHIKYLARKNVFLVLRARKKNTFEI